MRLGPGWLFVSVPKCATHTLYNAFEKIGGKEHAEPWHARTLCEECQDMYRVTACRDPYDRALSIWKFAVWSRDDDKYSLKQLCEDRGRPLSFKGMLQAFLDSQETAEDNILRWTQRYHREPCEPFDAILRVENLQEDFDALPFTPKNIGLEHLKARPFDYVITPEERELVEEYYAEDMEFARC